MSAQILEESHPIALSEEIRDCWELGGESEEEPWAEKNEEEMIVFGEVWSPLGTSPKDDQNRLW